MSNDICSKQTCITASFSVHAESPTKHGDLCQIICKCNIQNLSCFAFLIILQGTEVVCLQGIFLYEFF